MSLRWIVIAGVAALLGACSRQNNCSAVTADPNWKSMVAEMSLPDYRAQRLDDYVNTLSASGCQVAQLDASARTKAAATLDREITRSVPLFVPVAQQARVHDYLVGALRLR